MDILESLHNTILLSNKTLQKLHESKYKINEIEKSNENTTNQISYANKILESFKSFYNRMTYKKDQNIELKTNNITKNISDKELKTNNITKNISDKELDAFTMLTIIKNNNNLIGNELDQQNYILSKTNIDIENNNLKVKEMNSKIVFS